MSSTEMADDVFLQVMRLQQRCRAKRSAEEDDALIAQAERDRDRLERDRVRRQIIEQARDSDAWLRQKRDRAVADEEANIANGLVEVRIAPGGRWTLAWFQDNVSDRLPGFDPRNLDPNLGVLAILFGLQRLEDKLSRGRRPASHAGYVVSEARAVMAGKRTTWVSQAIAEQNPALVVRDNTTTYVGRLCEQWDRRQQELQVDDEIRRRRGLVPAQDGEPW